MNYYRFSPDDQKHFNWLIFVEHREPPYHVLRPRYESLVCGRCKKFDHDKVFGEGFDKGLKIRVKGDMFYSEEGFYCFNDKVKQIVESYGFSGLVFKSIKQTGWHAINVACRVDANRFV